MDGRLPVEQELACCGTTTDGVRFIDVVCEQAVVTKDRSDELPAFLLFFSGLFFGWILLKRTTTLVRGKDLGNRLPIRLCPVCGVSLSDREIVLLFRKVPLYHDLLAKFPNSTVRLARKGPP